MFSNEGKWKFSHTCSLAAGLGLSKTEVKIKSELHGISKATLLSPSVQKSNSKGNKAKHWP